MYKRIKIKGRVIEKCEDCKFSKWNTNNKEYECEFVLYEGMEECKMTCESKNNNDIENYTKLKCIKNYITDGIVFEKDKEYLIMEDCKDNSYLISNNQNIVYLDLSEESIQECFEKCK